MTMPPEERQNRARVTTVVGVCLLVSGVIATFFAARAIMGQQRFSATALRTEGVSVGRERVSGDGGWHYGPVYAFRDQNGVTRHITDAMSRDVRVGQRTMVRYLPANPANATLDPDADLGIGVFFLMAALLMAGMGVWVIVVARRFGRGETTNT